MSDSKASSRLYVKVLIAIALGVALGAAAPATAVKLGWLGEAFVKLVKMIIAPVVFTTVVAGIACMGDLKKVGRVGVKTLLYFELVTTLALGVGLLVVNVVKPGLGIHASPSSFDLGSIAQYQGKSQGTVEFLTGIIPSTVVDAFAKGEMLQVLLFSVLFGVALAGMGSEAGPVIGLIERLSRAFFNIVGLIMKVAPLGAFGAMAFTVGKFGIGSLLSLGKLMLCVYTTCLVFVIVGLGVILRSIGLGLWPFLRYIKDEILIVLGTSSSEAALPHMMEKLERAGCSRAVVGLVIPTGYSFNLDGTSIYLTMAAVFIAQATDTPLDLGHQLLLLGILMLTSKGAAAVTGGGFITLAATLSAVGTLPVGGLTLLLGVDRFMSEARAITNLIGNGVATLFIAAWEKELDLDRARAVMSGHGTGPVEQEPEVEARGA